MAFGSGVLLSSVAYELVEEAVAVGGQLPMATRPRPRGDHLLHGRPADRPAGRGRHGLGATGPASPDSGLAIVLGAALDGVPESVVLGLSFSAGEGIGLAFLVAVFLSNLPEGIAGTAGLLTGGWARARIHRVLADRRRGVGRGRVRRGTVLAGTRGEVYAFILGFAGGAILTMLADTLIPEAFEHAGKAAGLATTLGFGLAFALSLLD